MSADNTALGVRDADLVKSIALPNAAATVVTAGVDVGAGNATIDPVGSEAEVNLVTTLATGVDTKIITCKLQDSADNVTFADIAGLGTRTITAASSAYAASTFKFRLPPHTRRYVRGSATGESGGGNASDGTLSLVVKPVHP